MKRGGKWGSQSWGGRAPPHEPSIANERLLTPSLSSTEEEREKNASRFMGSMCEILFRRSLSPALSSRASRREGEDANDSVGGQRGELANVRQGFPVCCHRFHCFHGKFPCCCQGFPIRWVTSPVCHQTKLFCDRASIATIRRRRCARLRRQPPGERAPHTGTCDRLSGLPSGPSGPCHQFVRVGCRIGRIPLRRGDLASGHAHKRDRFGNVAG